MHSDGSLEAEGLCAVEDMEGNVPRMPLPTVARHAKANSHVKVAQVNSLIHAKPVGINPQVSLVKSLPAVGAAKARVNEVLKLNNLRHL